MNYIRFISGRLVQSTWIVVVVWLHCWVGHVRLAEADYPTTTRPATRPAAAIVSLTQRAAEEIKAVAATQKLGRYWLRVGVKPKGDGKRFTYVLDITEERPDPKVDNVFESQGVAMVVDEGSTIYLMGAEVDFRDDHAERGFVFRNPNAVKE